LFLRLKRVKEEFLRAKLRIILPTILLLYIALETILKVNSIELCSSDGCKMAGDLLKFNSIYLNYMGMIGAFTLILLALIKSEIAKKLYSIALTAMVIFESLLIASQLNLNLEVCKFCLGVYSLLLIMLLNDNIKRFFALTPAIASIFVAFSFLAIPKNIPLITDDGLYLIASKSCPHCKEAKAFLDENRVEYQVIDSKDINAFYFAKSLNIKKIPIAIDKRGDNYKIYVGTEKIKDAFKSSSVAEVKERVIYNSLDSEPRRDYYRGDKSEGCTLSIYEEESNCNE
jgi:uncharacterized membrane protein